MKVRVSFSVEIEAIPDMRGLELNDAAMAELKEYAWDLMVGGEAILLSGSEGWSYRPVHNGQMDTSVMVHRVR
jgi:hypothetical protein